MTDTLVRQSPFIILFKIIVLSAFLNFIHLGTSMVRDYVGSPIVENVLGEMTYDTLIFLGMMFIQMTASLWLLIKWMRSSYTIKEGFIVHRCGLILKHEQRFTLKNIQSISHRQTILGKILQYGTVEIEYTDKKEKFRFVEYPERMIRIIEENRT